MKYDKLIFIYPFSIGSFLNAKVGLEGTLEEGDDYLDCFHKIRKDVKLMADIEQGNVYDAPRSAKYIIDEASQYGSGTTLASPSNIVSQTEPQDLPSQIRSCTAMYQLAIYEKIIDKKKDPEEKRELWLVYDEMFEKLSNTKK